MRSQKRSRSANGGVSRKTAAFKPPSRRKARAPANRSGSSVPTTRKAQSGYISHALTTASNHYGGDWTNSVVPTAFYTLSGATPATAVTTGNLAAVAPGDYSNQRSAGIKTHMIRVSGVIERPLDETGFFMQDQVNVRVILVRARLLVGDSLPAHQVMRSQVGSQIGWLAYRNENYLSQFDIIGDQVVTLDSESVFKTSDFATPKRSGMFSFNKKLADIIQFKPGTSTPIDFGYFICCMADHELGTISADAIALNMWATYKLTYSDV